MVSSIVLRCQVSTDEFQHMVGMRSSGFRVDGGPRIPEHKMLLLGVLGILGDGGGGTNKPQRRESTYYVVPWNAVAMLQPRLMRSKHCLDQTTLGMVNGKSATLQLPGIPNYAAM